MKLITTVTLLLSTTLMVPSLAKADDTNSKGQFILGIGGGYATSLYDKSEDKGFAFPYLSYEKDRFSIGLSGLSYDVVQSDNLTFTAMVTPGESPDFPDKKPLYAGLKRDASVDIGIGATYNFLGFYVEGTALHDVTDKHGGHSLDAKLGTALELGRFSLDFGIGARYRDDKLSNHLYGVKASEANGLRAAYDAGSTVETYASLSLMTPISDRAAVVGSLEYRKVGNDVHNSPLVSRDDAYSAGIGVMYSF
ncbi:MAG: MipA/OmpV family protein [Halocynthiibacter sp.]